MRSSFVAILLFYFSLILSFMYVEGQKKCECTNPYIHSASLNIPGKKTCANLASLSKTVFRYKESEKDCKGESLLIQNIVNRVPLSSSYFEGPSLAFKHIEFSNVCVADISSNFFSSFIKSENLAFISFQGVRCLKKIRRDVFKGLPKLKQLRISSKDLTTVENGAFSNMESLEELEISKTQLSVLPDVLISGKNSLTDINLSENNIESLSSSFFDFPSTTELKVNLQKNRLSTLPPDIFLKLNLKELLLSFNKLTRLDLSFNDLTLRSINRFWINNNQITRFNETFMKSIESSQESDKFDMDISNNQLVCDCSASWMLTNDLLKARAVCTTPSRLAAQTFDSLTKKDFCQKNTNTMTGKGYDTVTDKSMRVTTKPGQLKDAGVGSGVQSQEIIAIAVAVVIIVLGLITVFLLYRFRSRLSCSKKNKGEMKAQYTVANTKEPDAGYNGEPVARETYVV